jgi:hypothetical protein
MTSLKTDISGLKTDLSAVKADLSAVKDTATLMEIEHGNQLRALYDATLNNTEKLEEHTVILDRIDRRLDRLETVQGVHAVKIERLAK